jgi:hypothetical protein
MRTIARRNMLPTQGFRPGLRTIAPIRGLKTTALGRASLVRLNRFLVFTHTLPPASLRDLNRKIKNVVFPGADFSHEARAVGAAEGEREQRGTIGRRLTRGGGRGDRNPIPAGGNRWVSVQLKRSRHALAAQVLPGRGRGRTRSTHPQVAGPGRSLVPGRSRCPRGPTNRTRPSAPPTMPPQPERPAEHRDAKPIAW